MKRLILIVLLVLEMIFCLVKNKDVELKNEVDETSFFMQNERINSLNEEEYLLLFSSKDRELVFIYSPTCLACKNVYKNYLLPFLENRKMRGNFVSKNDLNNYDELEKYHQKTPYIYFFEDEITVLTPIIEIIDEGKIVAYMVGENKNIYQFLGRYF